MSVGLISRTHRGARITTFITGTTIITGGILSGPEDTGTPTISSVISSPDASSIISSTLDNRPFSQVSPTVSSISSTTLDNGPSSQVPTTASSISSRTLDIEPSSQVPTTTSASSRSKVDTTTIGGGVGGALGFVILVMIGIVCIRRKWLHALPRIGYPKRSGEQFQGAPGSEGDCTSAPTDGEVVTVSREAGIPPSDGVDVAWHEGPGFGNHPGNSRSAEAGVNLRTERTKPRLPPPQQPTNEPSTESTSPSSGTELAAPGLSVEEMSSIVQEMESMRERMAQILHRQQQAAGRNSNLATFAPSGGGDSHNTAPPTYSETWQR